MIITVCMVVTYILWCIRLGTKPCKYFQLNSPYFDRREGIFSKIEIDSAIPQKWRLEQFYDDGQRLPSSYPAFLKPEWGQNAKGIIKVTTDEELVEARKGLATEQIRYLVQQGAKQGREFEIFSIRHDTKQSEYAILTVTEAVNTSEANPVNSIYNSNTNYCEITEKFSEEQKHRLWGFVSEIGSFNISRMSVRADSIEDLLEGHFHVIEINLFLPMPINMLDKRHSITDRCKMVLTYMKQLAKITRARDKTRQEKPVFTKIMLYDRRGSIPNYLRNRL